MKRTASFPADFGALGVGNERSCGWNSGAAQGIRAEFRIQFPRHSKRRNSGPNSVISNSWPNSIHPNGVLGEFWRCVEEMCEGVTVRAWEVGTTRQPGSFLSIAAWMVGGRFLQHIQ
jgi:hypothetical protein